MVCALARAKTNEVLVACATIARPCLPHVKLSLSSQARDLAAQERVRSSQTRVEMSFVNSYLTLHDLLFLLQLNKQKHPRSPQGPSRNPQVPAILKTRPHRPSWLTDLNTTNTRKLRESQAYIERNALRKNTSEPGNETGPVTIDCSRHLIRKAIETSDGRNRYRRDTVLYTMMEIGGGKRDA